MDTAPSRGWTMLLATAIAIPTVYIVWSWSRRRLPLRGLPRSPVTGLRDQLRHSRAHAAQSGALMPLGTRARVVTESNIPVRYLKWVPGAALLQYPDMAAWLRCVLRPVLQFIVSELEKTASAAKPRPSTAPAVDPGKPRDVFASLDPDLLVTDALPHHNIILNKFPVVPEHIVIVTKNFEPQESPLSIADWEAMWYCLRETDALVFFNQGFDSGASQPRKHMQLIPFDSLRSNYPDELRNVLRATPLDEAIDKAGELDPVARGWRSAFRLPAFDFPHGVQRLRPGWMHQEKDGAAVSLATIRSSLEEFVHRQMAEVPRMRERLETGPPLSWNLLLTRQWMALNPRLSETCGGISVNSIGFAGFFLVKESHQETLARKGPLAILRGCVLGEE